MYTAEKVDTEVIKSIQTEFNKRYNWGHGTGWETYYKALRRLRKSWDEILNSYKRSSYSDDED